MRLCTEAKESESEMKSYRRPFGLFCVGLMATVATMARASQTPELTPLVEGNTALALELYGKVRQAEGNLVLSPYSISSALAMVCAGARGETARQMEQVLHFTRCKTNLHELFSRLDAVLRATQTSGIELNIANSLWPQAKYEFRDGFLSQLKTHYRASLTPLDYARDPEQARATINAWVDEQTRHKITDIIGPGVLDELTRMVLVNAIYFKGVWAVPFPESSTQPDKFYSDAGKAITVPFMNRQGHFGYFENDELQTLVIPYRENRLQMVILLPRKRDDIAALESRMNPASLAAWTSKTRNEEVRVAMPKFKMSGGFKLTEALQALGLKDAFAAARADFSGMDGRLHWLYLSAVLHRAFIEVNEKGTEAAAATSVVITTTSVSPRQPREFRADHPFLFLIRESTTGTILFMGRVSKPENN